MEAIEAVDIPRTSYNEFSLRLVDDRRKRLPLHGMIEVTCRCNFRCAHCYMPHEPTGPELTKEELCDIVDAVAEEGGMWLTFTGGEPFVRHDFMEVYIHAKRRGLLTSIFTNASLITPEVADQLVDFQPLSVSITVYGATRETYWRVTGVPDSYDRVMRGIELLMDRGIRLELKTVVMTLNKHEFWEIRRFAKEAGVKFRYDIFINAGIDGSLKPCEVRLPPEEAVELIMSDEDQLKDLERFCEKFLGPPLGTDKVYGCGAGTYDFSIDSYGNLLLCLMLRRPSYSLREGPVRERFHRGFYEFFPYVRSQKRKKDWRCANCELINLCNSCPGHALLECGDPEGVVEYACRIAHLQMRELKRLGLVKRAEQGEGNE